MNLAQHAVLGRSRRDDQVPEARRKRISAVPPALACLHALSPDFIRAKLVPSLAGRSRLRDSIENRTNRNNVLKFHIQAGRGLSRATSQSLPISGADQFEVLRICPDERCDETACGDDTQTRLAGVSESGAGKLGAVATSLKRLRHLRVREGYEVAIKLILENSHLALNLELKARFTLIVSHSHDR